MNTTQWYPFLWALDGVLAFLVVILICALKDDDSAQKIWQLRDRFFFAMSQNPKRSAT